MRMYIINSKRQLEVHLTQILSSLFQKRKDGCGTFLALLGQYADTDKWEAEIKKQSIILHTRTWKGQSNFALERFVQQHRNTFVSMQVCSLHVDYQLPNKHSRVGFLLDAIKNDDAWLQTAVANVEDDTGTGRKREEFERASAHILPKDPVVKKRNSSEKCSSADISDTTVIAGKGNQQEGIGNSGVHLRFYKPAEYDTFTRPQKKELMDWRSVDVMGGAGSNKNQVEHLRKRTGR